MYLWRPIFVRVKISEGKFTFSACQEQEMIMDKKINIHKLEVNGTHLESVMLFDQLIDCYLVVEAFVQKKKRNHNDISGFTAMEEKKIP